MSMRTTESSLGVLEVIACSVEDAENAAKGGADRLEVIRGLEFGGYTPELDLVREIQRAVKLPLRVMLREEKGYGLTEVVTVERLCCMANALNGMKIDGVVLGFLQAGEIDVELTTKILACAPGLNATFHHAFEDAADKLGAIEKLKSINQIDRILSHGGAGTPDERTERLAAYAETAAPEITVLAGGGIDRQMIERIRVKTSLREFHVGRAARSGGKVSTSKVFELSRTVRGVYD